MTLVLVSGPAFSYHLDTMDLRAYGVFGSGIRQSADAQLVRTGILVERASSTAEDSNCGSHHFNAVVLDYRPDQSSENF